MLLVTGMNGTQMKRGGCAPRRVGNLLLSLTLLARAALSATQGEIDGWAWAAFETGAERSESKARQAREKLSELNLKEAATAHQILTACRRIRDGACLDRYFREIFIPKLLTEGPEGELELLRFEAFGFEPRMYFLAAFESAPLSEWSEFPAANLARLFDEIIRVGEGGATAALLRKLLAEDRVTPSILRGLRDRMRNCGAGDLEVRAQIWSFLQSRRPDLLVATDTVALVRYIRARNDWELAKPVLAASRVHDFALDYELLLFAMQRPNLWERILGDSSRRAAYAVLQESSGADRWLIVERALRLPEPRRMELMLAWDALEGGADMAWKVFSGGVWQSPALRRQLLHGYLAKTVARNAEAADVLAGWVADESDPFFARELREVMNENRDRGVFFPPLPNRAVVAAFADPENAREVLRPGSLSVLATGRSLGNDLFRAAHYCERVVLGK